MNYRQARQLAGAWAECVGNGEFAIVDKSTIAKPYGWLFFYQGKKYLETKEAKHLLAGNLPILIDRMSGEISHIDIRAKDPFTTYEARLPPSRLLMRPEEPTERDDSTKRTEEGDREHGP